MMPAHRSRPLRVVFTVQGEGRGHLSQALALRELLEEGGHRVVGLLVGRSETRALPAYFAERMGLEPFFFPSPTTIPGRDRRGVSVWRTATHNLRRIPAFLAARTAIRARLRELEPDLVVNFYDALAGMALSGMALSGMALSGMPFRREMGPGGRIPLVSIGHQYLLGHPDAPRPPFRPLQLLTFRLLNRLSAPPGVPRLALSFRSLPDGPGRHTRVIPPLLRRRILDAQPETGDHLLVYVLNDGYGDVIDRWHARHPEVRIDAFWDRKGAPEEDRVRPCLTFHRLSDTRFLERMRTCRGFVGTAGFESVAEALWLGKPVMVVPTGNQVEQAWNAREAEAAGAGMASERFDLTPFLAYLETHQSPTESYRQWVREGRARTLALLEAAGRGSSESGSAQDQNSHG
jgi:hypothetical protein